LLARGSVNFARYGGFRALRGRVSKGSDGAAHSGAGRQEGRERFRNRYRTAAEKDGRPSDITSLMFLGSRQQIEHALQNAGWSAAAKLNVQSKLATFKSSAP
jgi:hypothetical protein